MAKGIQPRALHFGAGNIGRGFIGAVLSQAGFHVTFADVNEQLIEAINTQSQYTVVILDHEVGHQVVRHVRAVNSTHLEALDHFAADLEIVTTAVGASESQPQKKSLRCLQACLPSL